MKKAIIVLSVAILLLSVIPLQKAVAVSEECARCRDTWHPRACWNCLLDIWWDGYEYEPLWGEWQE